MPDPIRLPGMSNDGGATRALRGQLDVPAAVGDDGDDDGSIIDRIKALLVSYADELDLGDSPSDLEVTGDRSSSTGRYIRLRSLLEGIPLFGSEIATQVVDDAIVRLTVTSHEGRQGRNQVAGAGDITLSAARAIVIAAEHTRDTALSQKTEQVWFPQDDGLHLAWMVDRDTVAHDWRVVVDAYSGEVLFVEDRLATANGTALVFDPNPVVTANDDTFREGVTSENTLNAERVSVTLKDIAFDGTNYTLEGPYVKIVEKGSPSVTPPKQSSSAFTFTRTEDGFEAAMVYYHLDMFQRYIQDTLGISGVMSWSIPADVHLGEIGAYSPSEKYLKFGNSGPTRPDRAEDADCMIHEYGHAIQHDMVPGWGAMNPTTGRRESRAMGEGFGDVLACIYFHEKGNRYHPEVFEDWVFAPEGLRRVDGHKKYPGEGTTGTVGDWVDQVHADGEIWSAALWTAYLGAGGNSTSAATRAATRTAFLRTLILHHDKLTGDASFPEAAEAMLEQNCEDPGIRGAQVMALLDAFHDRNILTVLPGVDLWMKDNPEDTGTTPSADKFWRSPDLWIRNADDGGTEHQNPEFGQDNWIYARVRNRGTAACRAFAVTFQVKEWLGTQFVYKADFVPYISAAVGFNLAAGGEAILKVRWPRELVPPAGTHGCLLASAYCATESAASGKHVWQANNLAQKNLHIVDALPDEEVDVPVRIGNDEVGAQLIRLEVLRPQGAPELRIALTHPDRKLMENLLKTIEQAEVGRAAVTPVGTGIAAGITPVVTDPAVVSALGRPVITLLEPARVKLAGRGLGDEGAIELQLAAGSEIAAPPSADEGSEVTDGQSDVSGFYDAAFDRSDPAGVPALLLRSGPVAGFPLKVPPRFSPVLRVKARVPANARKGETYDIDVVQRQADGGVVGGVTIRLRVK